MSAPLTIYSRQDLQIRVEQLKTQVQSHREQGENELADKMARVIEQHVLALSSQKPLYTDPLTGDKFHLLQAKLICGGKASSKPPSSSESKKDILSDAKELDAMGDSLFEVRNLDNALEHFQRSLKLKETFLSNALDNTELTNLISRCTQYTSRIEEKNKAVIALKDLLEKRKRNSCSSEEVVSVITQALGRTSNPIFAVTFGQSKVKSLFLSCQDLFIQETEQLKVISPSIANSHNNIGLVYQTQGKLEEAFGQYKKALEIQERHAPNSLDLAISYYIIGGVYKAQGKLEEAFGQYKKALEIQERHAPNSLDLAISYCNIGLVYQTQGKLSEALELFQKAFFIQERDLIPKHPELLHNGYFLANTALKLSHYDLALEYGNKLVQKDPTFKYSYDIIGQVLHKQKKLEEALKAFNEALKCDPGYADAEAHRLEVLVEIEREKANFQKILDEIEEAKKLKPTDYDEKKKEEWKKLTRTSREEMQSIPLELPEPEFKAGSPEYLEFLESSVKSLKAKIKEHDAQLKIIQDEIEKVKDRLGLLEGHVLDLKDSMGIIQSSLSKIEERIKDAPLNSPLLHTLLEEKQKLQDLEQQIKEINKDADKRHYFYAFLSELESAYLAAQIVKSGKFKEEKTETYASAAGVIGSALELIPVIGKVASGLLTALGGTVDTHIHVKNKLAFLRIRNLASSVEEFDQIALRTALGATLENTKRLSTLNKAEVPSDWKTKLSGLTDGLEGLITKFIEDNETQAKVLGRLDAFKILSHLQEDAVAENYAQTQEETTPKHRRKQSIIGTNLVDAMKTHDLKTLKASLTELIEKVKTYNTSKPQKQLVKDQLLKLLEERQKESVKSEEVLNFVNIELNKTDNPLFETLPWMTSEFKKLFEESRELLKYT